MTRDMFLLNRKNEPAHYLLKIESFSILSEAGTLKIESEVFEASSHKWRLDLYPNGNKEEKGDNHISLYLTICNTESSPKGWNVQVDVNFFVYDHIAQHYVSFHDDGGNMTRFHENQMRWGFDKLIPLEHFKESSKGYLVNDSCVFGAEVFVVPVCTQNDRCLSMIKPPSNMNTYSWTVDKFSAIKEEKLISEVFKVGKVKWYLSIYFNGNQTGAGTNLSIYLNVHEAALCPADCRVYAKFELRIKNQAAYNDRVKGSEKWFSKSASGWGYKQFIELSELGDKTKGFLLKDRLIVEAKISVVGIQKNFM